MTSPTAAPTPMAPDPAAAPTPVGVLPFRFEDFAQDGRPLLGALPAALSAVWRSQPDADLLAQRLRSAGIVPILTRIEIELGDDSFSPFRPGRVHGKAELLSADVRADANPRDHARVLFDLHARVDADTGHALLPHGPSEPRTVGTLVGEHVLTRLLAERGGRRVEASDVASLGIAVEGTRVWLSPQSILDMREGRVTALTPGFVRDVSPCVFGLMHTDANQHVNSLVYPQLFEEAVLRRLSALGRGSRFLARRLSIGYRKPSFAGETVSLDVALYEQGARVVALGRFAGEGEDDPSRARVYVRMELTA